MNILKKYKRYKQISTFGIVAISLVVAFGVNFFVLNNTDLSKNLKTSLLESEMKNNLGNIYFEKSGNDLILKSSKNIENIENLSFSLTYNPENVEILDIIPKLNGEVINISNTPGLSTILIEYSEKNNINSGDKILTLKINKLVEKTENINIINANFTDYKKNTFELSVNGITF